jgi:hypothetical protein
MEDRNDFWTDATLLHRYSRADAIADGVLVDVTDAARAVGLTLPVAMTDGAHHDLGADDPAECARVMAALRVAAGLAPDEDRVELVLRGCRGAWVRVWAHVGPGDDPRPVMTVMREGED